MEYRRSYLSGGTFFFTTVLEDRNSDLLTKNIDILRESFRYVKTRHPFKINGIVILPDHIHTIWTLPESDPDFSLRWRLIKTFFSRNITKKEFIPASKRRKGERNLWQRRFWERQIRDSEDYEGHMDYMYFNPVKHGYVTTVKDWQFSSFHRDVKMGIYPLDWAGGCATNLNVGEAF